MVLLRVLVVVALVGFCGLVWIAPSGLMRPADTGLLEVHMLDVGQGDAILIVTPEGNQILVDGGPNGLVLQQLAHYLPFWDRQLEVVLSTHPDLDHIAGLVDVLAAYTVPTIITTEAPGSSPAAAAWQKAIVDEQATIHYARADEVYQVGASTTLRILSPRYDPERLQSNSASIVALLTYGDTAFMLTGDAPQGVEEYLLTQYGTELEAEVLKLGHHGSDTSSNVDFVAAVNPTYAVVSAGVANRYGHPHPAVIERIGIASNAQVLSTQHGTVSFLSDGSQVWLK